MDLTHFISELQADQQYKRWRDGTQVTTTSLLQSMLDEDCIHDMERKLKLLFIWRKEANNTCFATYNSELRDDYKQVFELGDVWYSLHGALFMQRRLARGEITPDRIFAFWNAQMVLGTDAFWKLVRVGRDGVASI